jgi:protein N-terminal amidase
VRIACLQFDPQLMQVAANQARANRIIDGRLTRGGADVLLLPEMAFTGYCFQSRDEIFPFCEDPVHGPTASWCADTARALDCVVVAGFPESGADGRLFNSLLVVDRGGRVVHVYRKHFLYMTDESWASEGPDFSCQIIDGLGACAFGICMDLNPKKFEAPFDRFEFASALFEPSLEHHQTPAAEHRLKANLILICNNWLRVSADALLGDEEYCRYLVNYWAQRLLPVLGQPAVVAIANRVGTERGTRFAGCSCVIDLEKRTLLGRLNGVEEDVLMIETDERPAT